MASSSSSSSSSSCSSYETVVREFVEAVSNGNLKLVKRLISESHEKELVVANVKDYNGRSALHIAALGGYIPICKYLIEELKVDVNINDQKGETPLYHAIVGDRFSIARYLLQIGADPNKSDDRKLTALHLAARKGLTELIRLLISKGAVVDAEADNGMGTPLLMASSSGNKEAVRILLEHNANPNKTFNHVHSPLSMAIITKSYGCVQVLLEAGVDTNLGQCGVTPIEIAVFDGEIEITKWLLKAGANPNVVSMYDDSPIETAALHRNLELIKILLPVTTRNPNIQDWSCSGIIEYVHSKEVREQKKIKRLEYFVFAKSKGEEEVKRKNYLQAIYWYSEAYEANPNVVSDAILMSNRSFCHAKMNLGDKALSDAMECLRLRPDWPKAHYRVGVAWNLLKHYRNAAKSFAAGLKLDPSNKELEAAYWKATCAAFEDVSI